MRIVGMIVIGIGALIWCGNVFHFMPTIPLLGWGIMFVGGMIMRSGSKNQPQ
jgi:hypothetical protein